jgi:hypothetical protein
MTLQLLEVSLACGHVAKVPHTARDITHVWCDGCKRLRPVAEPWLTSDDPALD